MFTSQNLNNTNCAHCGKPLNIRHIHEYTSLEHFSSEGFTRHRLRFCNKCFKILAGNFQFTKDDSRCDYCKQSVIDYMMISQFSKTGRIILMAQFCEICWFKIAGKQYCIWNIK